MPAQATCQRGPGWDKRAIPMPHNLLLHVNRKFGWSHTFCLFHNLLIQVFLVTGGNTGSSLGGYWIYLDSTEVYDPTVSTWVVAGAKLPRPMCCLRAIKIDDRVLMFGNFLINLNAHNHKIWKDAIKYTTFTPTLTNQSYKLDIISVVKLW